MSELGFELSSNCVVPRIPASFDGILSALENGFMSTSYPVFSLKDVKTKLMDFQNYLNSVGRISMLHAGTSDREEIVFLLLNLKKCFKTILTELGKTRNKTAYKFNCSECSESILVEPGVNMWCSLQQHLHFEEAYANKNFNVTGHETSLEVTNLVESEHKIDTLNENNTDSGIEQVENDVYDRQDIENQCSEENFPDDVNGFRFNFQLQYDEVVENKLYPESFVKEVKKYDQIADYTILRAGTYRAVCLLCPCDLVSRSRISKPFILDHVMGQRHLRCAANPTNLSALKCFHECFLNLDNISQAHQLFFRPEVGKTFRCILCNAFVVDNKLKKHILVDPHRRKVIDLFEKNDNVFYLTDVQIHLYGPDSIAKAEARMKAIEEKKKLSQEKRKTDSESSPSPETKEPIHNIIKSVENPQSNNVLELLPNRLKEHLEFLKHQDKWIHCSACKGLLAKDIETVKNHVRQTSHLRSSNVSLKKYNYFCEICNTKYTDELTWHKHFADEPIKHSSIPASRKERVTEYECTKCMTVIFGDEISLLRHLSTRKDRRVRGKETKLDEKAKKLFASKDSIQAEGNKLKEESNKTLQYNEKTRICCFSLETALHSVFPQCKAYPFGSRVSGLGNQDSDLDVFLDVGNMYHGSQYQDSVSQVQIVRKAAGALAKSRDHFKDVFQIPTARTPIVKFHHIDTDILCDVSFRHGLSVENTKFLRFCIDIQPITQPFILVLKKWSEYNMLDEHITTYALAIMAIFYLQIHYHLLSVKEIRQLNPEKPVVINGWETINYSRPLDELKKNVKIYPHNLYTLLKNFFSYFANFQYSTDVVCPLLGKIIKKNDFLDGGRFLPPEMHSYILQLQRNEPEPFRSLSVFCIQDPFDLSHNLTKALQPGTLNKFKRLCELSLEHLSSVE